VGPEKVRLERAERPREKLLDRGPDALSDADFIALLLGSGIPGCSAVAMARSRVKDFGGLRDLLNAPLARWRRKGTGLAGYAAVQAAVELAKRHLLEQMRTGSPLTSPQATCRFFRASRLAKMPSAERNRGAPRSHSDYC
jgi:DNA repair protein RadC